MECLLSLVSIIYDNLLFCPSSPFRGSFGDLSNRDKFFHLEPLGEDGTVSAVRLEHIFLQVLITVIIMASQ